jgi:uncharacterized protein YndB with AHSA1/START domain
MTTKHSPIEDPWEREFVITRISDAPRSLVFKAWTEPEHQIDFRSDRAGFWTLAAESGQARGGSR